MNHFEKKLFPKRVLFFLQTYRSLFYAAGAHLLFLIVSLISDILFIGPCFIIQIVLAYKFYGHFGDLFAVSLLKNDLYMPRLILPFIIVVGFFTNSLIFSMSLPLIAEYLLPGYQVNLMIFYFFLLMFNVIVYVIFDHLRYTSMKDRSLRGAVS